MLGQNKLLRFYDCFALLVISYFGYIFSPIDADFKPGKTSVKTTLRQHVASHPDNNMILRYRFALIYLLLVVLQNCFGLHDFKLLQFGASLHPGGKQVSAYSEFLSD